MMRTNGGWPETLTELSEGPLDDPVDSFYAKHLLRDAGV